MQKTLPLIALAALCSCVSNSQTHPLVASGKVLPHSGPFLDDVRVAACAPANALRDLEWNNIEALIETGGSLWQDRAVGRSHYFAPKGGTLSVLFAGALWLGGISPDQQLKLAAITYRYDGNDYWAGPLTTDGTAEIAESQCTEWDRFYISYRTDAQRHRQYWECQQDPDCDMAELFPAGYSTPDYFYDYPAHGNTGLQQDFYLAPFYDFDGSGHYNPEDGDYPWYDFLKEIDCAQRKRTDPVPLFGDQTYYWIFNDKGNVHSESAGQPIGMEIRAQAFAFNTNDEINNMTFYNYVLINQGTQTFQETYFGTWIDCDIGGHLDDYVGCDVQRGLGYCYNGYAVDTPTGLSSGYGDNPPAVGVDFFEGPYQDDDDIDNPLTTDFIEAINNKGIPYKGIGIGYGDGVIDNERFGMRKFLYHGSGAGPTGLPTQPLHYYNFLKGYWKNNQRMEYYGNAFNSGSGVAADYMFPGDSDPFHWGTNGEVVDSWTEVDAGNPPADRRFMQSAGPFTLEPGEYNNITVGVVFARAFEGDPFQSVELVRDADDKAQALFDNCFELISGPDSPDVTTQELDKQIILQLTNENPLSNNYQESYSLIDPTIPLFNIDDELYTEDQRSYKFQGYLVYQLANEQVSASELNDIDKARLIAQCDVKDGVTNIINYYKNIQMDVIEPQLMVQGSDEDIIHSISVTEDAFALGDNKLVNHRTYYFMAIAYGYNNYANYDVYLRTGQDEPFLASRKGPIGEIPVVKAIPHRVDPEAGGSVIHAAYGDGVFLTRHEGKGNGLNELEITAETEQAILNPANGYIAQELTYKPGHGPVNIKVVDPLLVTASDFDLRLGSDGAPLNSDTLDWTLTNLTTGDVFTPYHAFSTHTEDIVLGTGLSINWGQYVYEKPDQEHFIDLISSAIEFDDPTKPWLTGIADGDGQNVANWIRSGTAAAASEDPLETLFADYKEGASGSFTDEDEVYEKVIGGTWAPYCLVGYTDEVTLDGMTLTLPNTAPTIATLKGDLSPISPAYIANIAGLNNVDVVLTSDKSKWTRCPVFEMQGVPGLTDSGNGDKMKMRQKPSVDKNGNADGTGTSGMGWFPGYAMDIGTGERLNMAFGEDSWLVAENGRDMIWNPSDRAYTDIGFDALFGGQHWIYVFRNLRNELEDADYIGRYDEGQFLYDQLSDEGLSTANWKKLFRACTWVGSTLLEDGYQLLSIQDGLIPQETRIKLRVAKPYKKFSPTDSPVSNQDNAENYWNPYYSFTTRGLDALVGQTETLNSVLDIINVVPNPYYAFSTYESDKLDTRVKVTNLPEECTVTIYNLTGTLIRQFKKADPLTSLDWDLKNSKNIPVASGVYIIHIDVPGVGEKILKWFGVMRPTDLDNM